jgi:acyl-CoA dehydrogenase
MSHLNTELFKQVHLIGQNTLKKFAADVDEKSRFPSESIQALKEAKLLGAYVSKELGGLGLNFLQINEICEILGHYCGSTAMIFSMHQIQVACISNHRGDSKFFKEYLQKLALEQRLIASATTETGIGGDLRSSICAVEPNGDGTFNITKKAPVISYGNDADDLILTSRKNPDAPKSDQVHVLLTRGQYELDPMNTWDALGFRGTCSDGFTVTGKASMDQVIPTPFADILSQTMHPFAHITWSSLWSGIAADAVDMARAFVKNEAKKNLDMPPISAIRLGEVDSVLQTMRSNITVAAENYQRMIEAGDANAFSNFGVGIHTNNVKIASSELIVDIVGKSMLICGISSYRNDSQFSLCRHIRDAYGAALMVNNDRIMLHNSTLLLMHSEKVSVK